MRAVAHGITALGQGAEASQLPDGRLLLTHGPINLVVSAEGPAAAVRKAYARLQSEFPTWLSALVPHLARLRRAESADLEYPDVDLVRRMLDAVRACRASFITPMAAVAGAVADEAISVMAEVPGLERAIVNNGGDIALHLAPGQCADIGVVPSLADAFPTAVIGVDSTTSVRGLATSGWQGRSHSLGVADAVTALAKTAAHADAAATLIANAVDVDADAIERCPAVSLDEDSDLGTRLVTVGVAPLTRVEVAQALDAGWREAERLWAAGVIEAAALSLQGQWRLFEPSRMGRGLRERADS